MPTVEDYLIQADRNAEVAGRLATRGGTRTPISLQWAVVCVFYAGVHYINAYLKRRTGVVPKNHGDRETCVGLRMDEPVHDALRDLKTACDDTRYKLADPTGPEYEESLAELDVIRTYVNDELRPGDTVH